MNQKKSSTQIQNVMKTVLIAFIILFISSHCIEGQNKNKKEPVINKPALTVYNVMDFGATGDGKTLDSPSINKAIEEAATKGGGTVYFPAGTYLSASIRLKSNISLFVDQGATILAASPSENSSSRRISGCSIWTWSTFSPVKTPSPKRW